MRPTFVYALLDPRTDRVRYVGYSYDPWERLHGHHGHVQDMSRSVTHKNNWLRGLIDAGYEPRMVVIDRCLGPEDAKSSEVSWIEFYRSIGEPLTNMTVGGDGLSVVSPEIRSKISASLKGRKRTKKSVQKQFISRAGYRHSEGTKEKIRLAQAGRKKSDKDRAAMRAGWERRRKSLLK